MGSLNNWFCWEIIKCENPEECPAHKNPGKLCWEIAEEADDYRKANNICRDCIVFMLKANDSVLSKQEIKNIVEKKTRCKLIPRYQRFANLYDMMHT